MEVEGTNYFISTVIIGVLIGASVLILFYILNLLKSSQNNDNNKKNENPHAEKKKESLASGKSSKKKVPEGRWTGRSEKQGFTHPWLLTSLKGHTAQVLDMDFASNGKYLASSAEEDPDPGGNTSSSSSSSDFNLDNSLPSSASPNPSLKGLSRRQRKNRRRDDHSPSEQKKKSKGKRPENLLNRKSISNVPLKQYLKLNLAEQDSASFLRSYLLSPEQMLTMGYPMESSSYPGRAIIFKSPMSVPTYTQSNYRYTKINVNESRFDVNAQEFIPGMDYSEIKAEWSAGHDSGQGSGSSSDSGDNIDDSEGSDISDKQYLDEDNCEPIKIITSHRPSDGRKCVRCGQIFVVTRCGEYLTQERCQYHWAKLENSVTSASGKHGFAKQYGCCRGKPDSRGCTIGKCHVWSGVKDGFNGPFDSYVRTRPRKTPPLDGNFGVYALDCEMCYTSAGLEVTKITVIALDGRLVYDTFVKPEREVVDYNTRYSGITAKDLCKKGATKTLREVQNDLMGFVNADTILVGHGLENDLRALKIIHYTVVDTAVAFPHYNGLPYRRSLKSLASSFLKREIQGSSGGHSSFEDARACMELMLWRIRKDFGSIIHYH